MQIFVVVSRKMSLFGHISRHESLAKMIFMDAVERL